jgi:predicted O-linked N-acetylglucosamine transferase (SPINDLY family)
MPLLKHHDRNQVEVYCYGNGGIHDELTAQLQSHADVWRNLPPAEDAVLADLVQNDGIDILIDLTMHMDGVRLPLFARKPAPVQISWLAYPGTTGLRTIDYRITDRYLDPVDVAAGPYTERSLVLPDTFWCYDPLTTGPEPGPLPAIQNGFVRFGSLNHVRKINDQVLRLWARIMADVDGSKLLMLAPEGQTRVRIREFLHSQGITADRIEFSPRLRRDDYLGLFRQIDIGLDPFPYGGHTTSLDSFWMGVPMVSLLGNTIVGRAALTLASQMDLVHHVATSPDEYLTIACNLARDLTQLATVRSGLRERMQSSRLMDYPRFARNMEAAYREAWKIWCKGGSAERTPILIADTTLRH